MKRKKINVSSLDDFCPFSINLNNNKGICKLQNSKF